MPLSTQVRDLSETIASELREGRGTRQSLGAKTETFGWISGLPVTLASFVETASAQSMTFTVMRVSPSGTPVAPVAAGAPKPLAVSVASDTVQLVKHAGMAQVNLEDVANGAGLLPAIQSVLGAGSLLSFEADAMATLDADSGASATGADWAAALAAGQAVILGNGGVPGVAVVSHLDYGTLINAITGASGFSQDPESAIGKYLGSALHISPKLAAGKAFVIDPAAVLAVQHADSPLLLSDPFSMSDTNQLRLVSDLIAATIVANPSLVCEVTVTP